MNQFERAAELGQLDILKHLFHSISLHENGENYKDEMFYTLQWGDYNIYELAAKNGHLDVVKYFISLFDEILIPRFGEDNANKRLMEVLDCPSAYDVYVNLAEKGRLDIIKYVFELIKQRTTHKEATKIINKLLGKYKNKLENTAIKNGHFDIVKYIDNIKSNVSQPAVHKAAQPAVHKVDYSKLTVVKLKELAKEYKLTGYSKMKKEELVKYFTNINVLNKPKPSSPKSKVSPPRTVNSEYSKMTVVQLKKIAQEKKLRGYTKMKKNELVFALSKL